MIRVLVADDHAVVRRGLEELLRSAPEIEFAGACSDGASAVQTVVRERPDVVLMDLAMPGTTNGIEATREIVEQAPETQVVVLTSFSDRPRIMGTGPPDIQDLDLLDVPAIKVRGELTADRLDLR